MQRESRTELVKVRCTPQEKEDLQQKAEWLDTTPSALLRALWGLDMYTLDELENPNNPSTKKVLVFDKTTYPKLRYQLRMWGYHYDHALHALNTIQARGYLPRDETRAYMDEAMDHLRQIDNARESLFEMVTMLLKAPGIQLDPVERSDE